MNREDILHRIRTLLSRFQEEVKIDNANSEYSINIHAENVLIPLLNKAYGLNLINANTVYKKNYPAIDLLDKNKRTAFQITSTGEISKITDTLRRFHNNGFDSEFDTLYFYFLKGMAGNISTSNPRIQNELGRLQPDHVVFLDHSEFYRHLNTITKLNELTEIKDLLELEFSDQQSSDSGSDNISKEVAGNVSHKEISSYNVGTITIQAANIDEIKIIETNQDQKSDSSIISESARKRSQLRENNREEMLASQSNIYHLGGEIIRFIPIISSWNYREDEYYLGDIITEEEKNIYSLPSEISELFLEKHSDEDSRAILDNTVETKVRLDDYSVEIRGGYHPHLLKFYLSPIYYRDYLIIRDVFDDVLPDNENTVRSKYFNHKRALITKHLSNICGVGIFIITSDNKVLISKASKNVTVNPEKNIYSASGSMDWKGKNTNPFYDIIRETQEEIGYRPNIENLTLYSVGIDYDTAYYQFSFYELSDFTASEIIDNASMARDFHIEIDNIEVIDFQISTVVDFIKQNNWDETAKANLLTLLVKFNTKHDVEKYMNPQKKKAAYRNRIKKEWARRSEREGLLAVMSNRYPSKAIEEISRKYFAHVKAFIDEELYDCKVLEVGGGIGIFTKYFAANAKSVTCVDVSGEMIERNKEYLGSELAGRVNYVNSFFQDYDSPDFYDILVCSLVLIHNEPELKEITDNMKRYSDVIYLFEHVEDGAQVSVYTDPKPAEEYIGYFPEYYVEKSDSHLLSTDKIAFIKLRRKLSRRKL